MKKNQSLDMSSWSVVIVIALVSVVAIISIYGVLRNDTTQYDARLTSPSSEQNLGGMVYNRGDTNLPAGFAPPFDPVLTSAPNYITLNPTTSGTNTNIQVTTTKDAPTMYIYKTGYYSINGAPWQQYNLLGTMDSTNNWITNGAATATITTTTPTSSTNVYVLAYVCKQYTGSTTWYCGPTNNPPVASDRKWTIQNTNIGNNTPTPGCVSDAQCTVNQTCQGGTCVPKNTLPPASAPTINSLSTSRIAMDGYGSHGNGACLHNWFNTNGPYLGKCMASYEELLQETKGTNHDSADLVYLSPSSSTTVSYNEVWIDGSNFLYIDQQNKIIATYLSEDVGTTKHPCVSMAFVGDVQVSTAYDGRKLNPMVMGEDRLIEYLNRLLNTQNNHMTCTFSRASTLNSRIYLPTQKITYTGRNGRIVGYRTDPVTGGVTPIMVYDNVTADVPVRKDPTFTQTYDLYINNADGGQVVKRSAVVAQYFSLSSASSLCKPVVENNDYGKLWFYPPTECPINASTGGQILLTGHGFDQNTLVTVNGKPCSNVKVYPGTNNPLIDAVYNNASNSAYDPPQAAAVAVIDTLTCNAPSGSDLLDVPITVMIKNVPSKFTSSLTYDANIAANPRRALSIVQYMDATGKTSMIGITPITPPCNMGDGKCGTDAAGNPAVLYCTAQGTWNVSMTCATGQTCVETPPTANCR